MRLSVTRKSDLALRALRTVAEQGGTIRGEELAAAIGTSRGFLVQVMMPLVRARWVASSPGPLGGYRLRAGSAPSVVEVIEAVEGASDTTTCVLDAETPCASVAPGTHPPCALHDPWLRAQQAMRDELGRIPALASLPSADLVVPKEAPHGS